MLKMNTQEVIDKYFQGKRNLYFHTSDSMAQIEGDTYLTYEKNGKIELWFCGNNGNVLYKYLANIVIYS